MTARRRLSRLARHALVAVAALALIGTGASTGLGEAGFPAPVITSFSARLSPCAESPYRCMDLSWAARDPGSSQLLYDLVVEHAGGRVTYAGSGAFRPGQRLRASLVPRSRPLCGVYLLTLTVTNDAQILTSSVVALTRRGDCAPVNPRRK